jgi:hypothetical protein
MAPARWAIAAVHAHAGYVVRKRPRHGSGADYLMTRVGDDAEHFIRLEVSGIARGDALELRGADRSEAGAAPRRPGRAAGGRGRRRVRGRDHSHGGRMNHEIFDDPRSHEADDLSLRAELAERRGELAAAQGPLPPGRRARGGARARGPGLVAAGAGRAGR